jgi:hypothetical protein
VFHYKPPPLGVRAVGGEVVDEAVETYDDMTFIVMPSSCRAPHTELSKYLGIIKER